MRRFFVFLLSAIAGSAAVDPPRDKFLAAFAPSDGGPAGVSPDGLHVAYAQREKGEVAVYIVALDDSRIAFRGAVAKADRPRLVGNTRYTPQIRVTYLRWADNDRVIVGTSDNHFIALDHRKKTGRHLVNLQGEEHTLGDESGYLSGRIVLMKHATGTVIAIVRETSARVVIEARAFAGPGETSHVVLKIDPATGKAETIFDEVIAGRLLYDPDGRVRGRYESGYVTDRVFLLKPALGKQKWQPLHEAFPEVLAPAPPLTPQGFFGERAFPISFGRDTIFFASSMGRDTLGIYSIDLQSGARTVLAEDSLVDLANPQVGPGGEVILDPASGKIAGLSVMGMQAARVWLDPEIAAVHDRVSARVPGYRVNIVNWDDARRRFVIELYSRVDFGGCYLYTPSADKLEIIVPQRSRQPALAKAMAQAWSLPRPGGITLAGSLVTPQQPVRRPVPVAVRLRGAPWSRPFFGYDADTMALAQMGYAVLEVDHRGTAGHGVRHLEAGRHRFDVVAADDIVAALDAIPPSSGVDSRNAALFGRDYGGYLALRALQLHPTRFSCAVTIEPATDLMQWLRPPESPSAYLLTEHKVRQWFFGSDENELRAHSPDPKAIRAPLFIAANPNSYRNHWSQISSLRRRLSSAGNVPTLVEITEGAGVPGAEQAQLWSRIEDFLAKHHAPR